jgi:hypothetical protein
LILYYSYGYTDPTLLEVIIENKDGRKHISGDWESIPTSLKEILFWLENSYPHVELEKVDTLTFETTVHPDTAFLQRLEDSLKNAKHKISQ